MLVRLFLVANLLLLPPAVATIHSAENRAPVSSRTGTTPPALKWENEDWVVQIDRASGGIVELRHPKDLYKMNWVRPPGGWGAGWLRLGGDILPWEHEPAAFSEADEKSAETTFTAGPLEIRVRRWLDELGRPHERFTFLNRSGETVELGRGAIGVVVPLPDVAAEGIDQQTRRCNAHLWMGGSSAYVVALRRGGASPHLGLVVTEGACDAYSIDDRPAEAPGDRGRFVLHPAAFALAPGESRALEWTLLWHQGWSDFFALARTLPGFQQLEAERFTVSLGEPLRIGGIDTTIGAPGALQIDGAPLPFERTPAGLLLADAPALRLGEHVVELIAGERRTLLRAWVAPPPLQVVRARVKFIVERQQIARPDDPLDGAYLPYDFERGAMIAPEELRPGELARAGAGMAALVALELARSGDDQLRRGLRASLDRHVAFLERELQDETGRVFGSLGRRGAADAAAAPSFARLHLALHEATSDLFFLTRAVDTLRAFYADGGEKLYPLNLPVRDCLRALKAAGWESTHEEILSLFRRHADRLRNTGTSYPARLAHEEQRLAATAAQIMLEVYLLTADPMSEDGAAKQIAGLLTYAGRQPDYRLHEVTAPVTEPSSADAMPHAQASLLGVVYQLLAEAKAEPAFAQRAHEAFASSLCLFEADGRAASGIVLPLRVNGAPAAGRLLRASEQDWNLVNWMLYQPATMLPGASAAGK